MDWRYASASCACLIGVLALVAVVSVEAMPQVKARTAPVPPVLIVQIEPAPVAKTAVAPQPPTRLVAEPGPTSPPPGALALPKPENPVVASLDPTLKRPPGPQVGLALPMPPIAPAPPKPRPPVVDHRYDGTLTVAEINRIKASLKLSRDQEPYWTPIANLLRELGRKQMAQVDAGQKPDFELSDNLSSRFSSAASALLQTLREDQKEEVRNLARKMGYGAYASFI